MAPEARAYRIAPLVVIGWLSALALLGAAELVVDPDTSNRAGAVLDDLSVVVLVLGSLGVPIGTAAVFRANGHGWSTALVGATLALCAYSLGTVGLLYGFFSLIA